MKACLILHKKSCMRPEVKAAVKHVRSLDIELSVVIPWSGKDLRRLAKQALKQGATRIISGGGDGTLNAVVNAMMKKTRASEASLGVLPLGTANDFARGAGIPLGDPTAALKLACSGNATPIDVGRMNKRCFINVASAGFGAEITATTPQAAKRQLGGAAYSIMGLIKAFNLKPYEGRLVLPDGRVQGGSMLIMAVGNNRYAGGGFDVAPKASLTDGLLDVAVVTDPRSAGLNVLIGELADPFNASNQSLQYRQLSEFAIETERPLHVNLDGEALQGTRFDFDIHPAKIDVVLGPSA